VGSAESNAELALGRAREVARELIEVGIDESLLRIDSHGEGNPLVITQDNVEEPRNRRVEVVVRH
jgi:outer membrane protein OmpA-like peptidoglycan-associated protein